MVYTRLSIFKKSIFKKLALNSQSFNSMNFNLDEELNKLGILNKMFAYRNVYLLKHDKEFVGYIWLKGLIDGRYVIRDMYITDDCIDSVKYLLSGLNVTYESSIDSNCNNILQNVGFKIKTMYDVLSCEISNDDYKYYEDTKLCDKENITFTIFTRNKDEEDRCCLQNYIFDKDNRIPIDVDDIFYDEEQYYYIENGVIFMKKDDEYIGMGQVIFISGRVMLVNFGIVSMYRNKGYGHLLLRRILRETKKICDILQEDSIYLKVDKKNLSAYTLYTDTGFKYHESMIEWHYD